MGSMMIDVHHHQISSNGVPTEGQRHEHAMSSNVDLPG